MSCRCAGVRTSRGRTITTALLSVRCRPGWSCRTRMSEGLDQTPVRDAAAPWYHCIADSSQCLLTLQGVYVCACTIYMQPRKRHVMAPSSPECHRLERKAHASKRGSNRHGETYIRLYAGISGVLVCKLPVTGESMQTNAGNCEGTTTAAAGTTGRSAALNHHLQTSVYRIIRALDHRWGPGGWRSGAAGGGLGHPAWRQHRNQRDLHRPPGGGRSGQHMQHSMAGRREGGLSSSWHGCRYCNKSHNAVDIQLHGATQQ